MDIKNYSIDELNALANDIRQKILETVVKMVDISHLLWVLQI